MNSVEQYLTETSPLSGHVAPRLLIPLRARRSLFHPRYLARGAGQSFGSEDSGKLSVERRTVREGNLEFRGGNRWIRVGWKNFDATTCSFAPDYL